VDKNADVLQIVKAVAQNFESLGIPYVLGGSLASSIQGITRFTNDADIAVEPFAGAEAELVGRFGPDFYISLVAVQSAVRERSSFNIIHPASGFKVDVFVRKERAFDKSALARRRVVELAEPGIGSLMVLSPEDIILYKLEWFRLGGEISDRQWGDVLGVLQVQGDRLDRPYMQKWAQDLSVADLLARAEQHAASE
jgi:hypothetical protein